jgi:hypothetical protein
VDACLVDLPKLTRAWMTHTRFGEAAARLRAVAPGPVGAVDLPALMAALGVDTQTVPRADVLRAISLAAEAHPDLTVRRALSASVDAALDAMYP